MVVKSYCTKHLFFATIYFFMGIIKSYAYVWTIGPLQDSTLKGMTLAFPSGD